jgi:hypothetical protein
VGELDTRKEISEIGFSLGGFHGVYRWRGKNELRSPIKKTVLERARMCVFIVSSDEAQLSSRLLPLADPIRVGALHLPCRQNS